MPEPFPWDRLPRYEAAQVHASNRCVALLGGDGVGVCDALRADLSALGIEEFEAALAFVQSHRGTTFQPEIGAGFATNFTVPGTTAIGAISIDLTLVDAALGALLGAPTAGVIVDDWDFGLIVWLLLRVQAVLVAHGATAAVLGAERRPPERITAQVCGPYVVHEIVTEVRIDRNRGWVRIFLPEPLLERLCGGRCGSDASMRFGHVPVSLSLGVGRVRLTGTESRSLGPGDVILLSDEPLLSGTAPARVRLDDLWFDADVRTAGGRWSFELTDAMPRRKPKETKMGEESSATTQVTHDANVEIEAVVGRATLTFSELSRLRPGQIFTADRNIGDPVEIVANGAVVAHGELVDVEGRLGVRILSLGR